jgi:hypothetical protein
MLIILKQRPIVKLYVVYKIYFLMYKKIVTKILENQRLIVHIFQKGSCTAK